MKLPVDVSGKQLATVLEKSGFVFQRQKGSHMIFRRANPCARVVVPAHRTLSPATLRQILHEAGLTTAQLLDLI